MANETKEERNRILEVEHLAMHFSTGRGKKKSVVKAIDDVSFHVYESETFGLVGESGCGKTTTGRALIRLYDPTSGSIKFKGRELTGPMNPDLRKFITSNMGMIFQDPIDSLNPRFTIREIIAEGLRIRGVKDEKELDEQVYAMLDKVGLTREHATRYPHEFSGGQRQRIGIARTIITQPSIVIADEPVSALDVSIQAQVINLLNDLKQEMGLTIVFIAHDLSVVKYFSDRIGVMYYGKLVEMANSDELYKHPIHPYTRALLSAVPQPNPITERKRVRLVYEPEKAHDYTVEKPAMTEVFPGHYVYASPSEVEAYRKEFADQL